MKDEEYTDYEEEGEAFKERNPHIKGYILVQERALEIYEYIQSSLDVTEWNVPIKSENYKKMSFKEFLEKAKKRIIYRPEFSNYNPSVVADDCINILETMPTTFDTIKNRMEDVFRSLLVVNEDMDGLLKDVEYQKNEYETTIRNLKKENQTLRDEIEITRIELQKKDEGLEPLMDIINIKLNDIINLYDDFKRILGNESEMRKFLPIFQKEIDTTKKLIEARKQGLTTKNSIPLKPYNTEKEERIIEADTEETTEEFPKDDITYVVEDETEEEIELPAGFIRNKFTIDDYKEAVANVERKPSWNEQAYELYLIRYILDRNEKNKRKRKPKS